MWDMQEEGSCISLPVDVVNWLWYGNAECIECKTEFVLEDLSEVKQWKKVWI